MPEPKQFNLELRTTSPQAVLLEGEAQQAGIKTRKKSWFHRFRVGKGPQRGRLGKFVLIEWFMKRVGFGNWYSEKVTDGDTGEVLHECHEPLDQHRGHGSAKRSGHNQAATRPENLND